MGQTDEQQQRAEGVSRQLNDEAPPKEKPAGDPAAPAPAPGADDVGESITRRGEDVKGQDGTEAGRADTGTKGQTDRPTGSTNSRESTGVDPQPNVAGGPSTSTG